MATPKEIGRKPNGMGECRPSCGCVLMGSYLEWYPKKEPPYAEPHVRWCERSVNTKVGYKHL